MSVSLKKPDRTEKKLPEYTPVHLIDNTIVLIDEIGTIFNSRDFQNNNRKGKGSEPEGLPKVLFQHICQVRHRHMVIFGTVQRWGFLEKQLRDITNDVTVCSAFPSHPFSRVITNYCYDAEEYNLFYQSPLRPLVPLTGDVWIQTDKLRALYDTKEMVNTMLKMYYVSDEETERNRAFEALGLAAPMDKKTEKKKAELFLLMLLLGHAVNLSSTTARLLAFSILFLICPRIALISICSEFVTVGFALSLKPIPTSPDVRKSVGGQSSLMVVLLVLNYLIESLYVRHMHAL